MANNVPLSDIGQPHVNFYIIIDRLATPHYGREVCERNAAKCQFERHNAEWCRDGNDTFRMLMQMRNFPSIWCHPQIHSIAWSTDECFKATHTGDFLDCHSDDRQVHCWMDSFTFALWCYLVVLVDLTLSVSQKLDTIKVLVWMCRDDQIQYCCGIAMVDSVI